MVALNIIRRRAARADTDVTDWIQNRANELLRENNRSVKRIAYAAALQSPTTHEDDLLGPYVDDLTAVIDLDPIRSARIKIGVDPLGGAALAYWQRIAERYELDLTVVNDKIDPTFRFMTLDHDGKIRMDCSSPYAMASLVSLKDQFQIAVGNDADSDRHGIVTPSLGLMNPNHYLAVAIHYLLSHRPQWSKNAAVGKTLVSSSLIDRVVGRLGRKLSKFPSGSNGFLKVYSKERSALAARRAPAPVFLPRWHGLDHGQRRHHSGFARRRDHRHDRA